MELHVQDGNDDAPELGDVDRAIEVVVAYVQRNAIAAGDLTKLIEDVHSTLRRLGSSESTHKATPALAPAVPIKSSVSATQIACLECGRPFNSLRRHLGVAHGLTPEDYRRKWGLPPDYPMMTAAYSERRSELAKAAGLGTRGQGGKPTPRRVTRRPTA